MTTAGYKNITTEDLASLTQEQLDEVSKKIPKMAGGIYTCKPQPAKAPSTGCHKLTIPFRHFNLM